VIPIPFGAIRRPHAIILSEAKDLGSSFRVEAVKTCCRAKKELRRFFAPLRMTGAGIRMTGVGFSMTDEALGTKLRGCRYDASSESNP
jgi:hypothetical protein